MTTTRAFFFGCLALGLGSCSNQNSPPAVDVVGNLGGTSGGSAEALFSIRSPHHQKGNQLTVVLTAAYPGKPTHAAVLLLAKLPVSNSFSSDGGSGQEGGKTYWQQNLAAVGKKFPVRYEFTQAPV